MSYLFEKIPISLFAILLSSALLFSACDSGGGMNGGNGDDNQAPTAKLNVNATEVVVGDTVRLDASGSSDPDGDNLGFNHLLESKPEGSDVSISSNSAETFFVADVDGDYVPKLEVSDGNGGSDAESVTVTALEKVPDEVTVNFENRATDGDSLVVGDLTFSGEVISEASGKKSGSFTTSGSRDSKQLCFTENDLFKRYCTTVTPNKKAVSVKLEVERKSVELAVSFDLPYGNSAEADMTVYEPFRSDSTQFTGEKTVELPKRAEGLTREVSGNLITDDPDDSSKRDRLTANTSVSANTDVPVTAEFSALPACSDQINNDPQDDELVDVWEDTNEDGIPSKGDVGDPGCLGPNDDNEEHVIVSRISAGNNANQWVANADNQRRELIVDRSGHNPLDESVKDAIAGVLLGQDFKGDKDESCEGFALRLKTGPKNNLSNTYTTSIKPDQDTLDGRATAEWVVPPSEFESGTYYIVKALHESLWNDLGDCLGRVDFLIKEGDEFWANSFSYAVEKEDFNGSKSGSAKTHSTTDEFKACDSTGCYEVTTDGYPNIQ